MFKVKYFEYFVGMRIERNSELRILKIFQKIYPKKVLNKSNCIDIFRLPADPNVKFIKIIIQYKWKEYWIISLQKNYQFINIFKNDY